MRRGNILKVEFVQEGEGRDIYCVAGSHIFEMPHNLSPEDLLRLSEVFARWASYVKDVATIDS
jgi:hypothetical protein